MEDNAGPGGDVKGGEADHGVGDATVDPTTGASLAAGDDDDVKDGDATVGPTTLAAGDGDSEADTGEDDAPRSNTDQLPAQTPPRALSAEARPFFGSGSGAPSPPRFPCPGFYPSADFSQADYYPVDPAGFTGPFFGSGSDAPSPTRFPCPGFYTSADFSQADYYPVDPAGFTGYPPPPLLPPGLTGYPPPPQPSFTGYQAPRPPLHSTFTGGYPSPLHPTLTGGYPSPSFQPGIRHHTQPARNSNIPGSRPPLQHGGQGSSTTASGGQSPPHDTAPSTAAASGIPPELKPKDQLDPRNLPLRRQAYRATPSTVNRGPPIMRSSASPVSKSQAVPRSSYAKVLTGSDMSQWKASLLKYLKEADCVDEYKHQVSSARLKLTIEFEHILRNDKELGLELVKHQGSNQLWLQEVANSFFKLNNFETENASIEILNLPTRLFDSKGYIESSDRSKRISLAGGEKTVDEATAHGRKSLDCIMSGILDYLAVGQSWCGEIVGDDLMLAEFSDGQTKLIITKPPLVREGATGSERLDDLWSIWRGIVTSYVTDDGKLPLYFTRLQWDLYTQTEFTPCFVECVRYHPVFYASAPRKNLVQNIQSAYKASKVPRSYQFNQSFHIDSYCNWRKTAKSGILLSILTYKEREKERKDRDNEKKSDVKEERNSEVVELNQQPERLGKDTKDGAVEEKMEEEEVVKDEVLDDKERGKAKHYGASMSALLLYHRNGLEHPEDHPSITDADELELFLAVSFDDFLPDLILFLIRHCGMKDEFETAWSIFKRCKTV